MSDLPKARKRDRAHRKLIEDQIARNHRSNPGAALPYDELSNGRSVLDEASAEFRLNMARVRLNRPDGSTPLSAWGRM